MPAGHDSAGNDYSSGAHCPYISLETDKQHTVSATRVQIPADPLHAWRFFALGTV
jgi:hypothetical protein